MTGPLRAAALLASLLALAGAAPKPTPPASDEEGEDRAERPVRFVEPAPEMRKLAPLVGTWSLRETWSEPVRFKRGRYEGFPGPGGSGSLTVRRGPGDFSLVAEYDARNPMGRVTALILLSWNPARRVYELDEIHSAFPGVLHLTGRFDGGDLVFRGEDARSGETRAVRLVWKELGRETWTADMSETGASGRPEPVVTTTLARSSPR